MADRIAEQGALQDAISNNEINPPRLSLAGYIRGLFLDWSASPYNPLTRLTARGRYLGYFWDNGAIGLSMDFANQSFIVKDGTLQSKSFSNIVNFSRTSNATVTNSAGVIGYAPHNLLTFSEQFDNAGWSKVNATVSANTTIAPNSTSTSDKLIADTALGQHRIELTPTSIAGTQTFSVYVKASEYSYCRIRIGITGAIFSLIDGTVSTGIGTFTSTSTNIGNGWWRFSITTTAAANDICRINIEPDVSGNGFSGNSVNGIYLWGAQLELGSTATTYNPTTVKNLLGYSELFDNAAWSKSNSFVQTNLLTFSEAFDNAAWIINGATVTANNTSAPNDTTTADKITADGTTINQGVYSPASSTIGITYTFSVYLKGVVGGEEVQIGDASSRKTVTLTTSWVRYTTDAHSWLSANNIIYAKANTAMSFYAWGAQLVQGSVAGDYRRTDAAALPVYYPNHNGVVVAEKLVSDTANQLHYLRQDFAGGNDTAYTASIYAKAGEWNTVQLEMITQAGNVKGIVVNLSTGVIGIGRIAYPTSYGATPLGNGWYRVWITNSNETGATSERINIFATNNGSAGAIQGDGTSGIYIFGAQLSDSASLDPYVLTAAAAPTAAAYYGPRFDYDPVTLQPKGLLIEEQRSNLTTYSDDFANAAWSKADATITSNAIVAPDGTTTADKLVETATTNNHYVTQVKTLTAASYTATVYLKAGERTWAKVALDPVAFNGVFFNLATGEVGTANSGYTGTITPVGNGWYRCAVTVTATAAGWYLIILPATSGSVISYAGDITKGIYLWGAQLEVGAFSTSYIPTVASQVTRTADVATIQGSNFYSWYNQNEGTLYVSAQRNSPPIAGKFPYMLYLFSNAGTGVQTDINIYQNGSTSEQVLIRNNGAVQATLDATVVQANSPYTQAVAYKVNDFSSVFNGGTALTDNSGNVPVINTLFIGSANSGFQLNGTIKKLAYYPVRLSNDVLKGLTA